MVVVNSSVLAYLYLPGNHTTEAESLLAGAEFKVDSRAVMALVRDSGCSTYDCEFVALANQLNTKLVTEDKKLPRAFPQWAVSLEVT